VFIILDVKLFDKRIDHIKYRNNVVTGEVATDNGNGTYDVYIAGSDVAYPNIPTTVREPDFGVGEAVEILIEYGNKEMPIIIGHAKKVVQEFVEDVINVLVSTLYAHTITDVSCFFEGRVGDIEGYENVIERGFYYGTSTGYGSDVSSTGSFAAGSYSEQVTGLTANTTYHFQAYVHDADNDVHTGEDKMMVTGGYLLFENQPDSSTIYARIDETDEYLGQHFTVESDHSVDKISVGLAKYAEDQTGIAILDLYNADGDGFPTGAILATANIDTSLLVWYGSPTETWGWIELTMDTSVDLTSGNEMVFIIRFPTASSSKRIYWAQSVDGSNPILTGRGIISEDGGSTWAKKGAFYTGGIWYWADFTFKIHGV